MANGKTQTKAGTGTWPYHRNARTGEMVKCASNPCSKHPDTKGDNADYVASSPEEATRLYYEINGDDATGLGAPAASTTYAPAHRPSAEFVNACEWAERGMSGTFNGTAAEQLRAIGADADIPDAVAVDYAQWLRTNALPSMDSDGYYRDARDDVALRPAEYVLDGVVARAGAGAGHAGPGANDPISMDAIAPSEPVLVDMDSDGNPKPASIRHDRLRRDDSSFLLHDFGHGRARSAKAIRILTGPAPSSGMMAGAGTDGAMFYGVGGSGRMDYDSVPTPDRLGGRWMQSVSPEDRADIVGAARHPWGGQALQDAFSVGHARLFGHTGDDESERIMASADPTGRFRHEELRAADADAAERVRMLARAVAATDGMAEMLTARDYERAEPGQIGGMLDAMRPHAVGRLSRLLIERASHEYSSPDAAFTSSDWMENKVVRDNAEYNRRGPDPDLKRVRALNVRAIAAAHELGCEPWRVLNALEHSRRVHDGAASRFIAARPRSMADAIRRDVHETLTGPFYVGERAGR